MTSYVSPPVCSAGSLQAAKSKLATLGSTFGNVFCWVPTDRRAYALKATLAGRQLYEKAVSAVNAHEAALLETVDEDMLATMLTAMKLIEKAQAKG